MTKRDATGSLYTTLNEKFMMKKYRAVQLLCNYVLKQISKVYFLVSGAVNAMLKASLKHQCPLVTFKPVGIAPDQMHTIIPATPQHV